LRNILVQEGDTMPGDRLELRYQKLIINGKNNSLDVVVSKGNKRLEITACKTKATFYKSNTFAANQQTSEWTSRTTYWKRSVTPPWSD
jgi:hypothetical protein